MDQRTADHLARSEQDRDLASQMILHASLGPASDRWAVVAAFYSAVHLVNGYLWERCRTQVSDHAARAVEFRRVPALRPIIRPYGELDDWSRIARYSERPRITATQAQQALGNVYEIDRHIRQLLGAA